MYLLIYYQISGVYIFTVLCIMPPILNLYNLLIPKSDQEKYLQSIKRQQMKLYFVNYCIWNKGIITTIVIVIISMLLFLLLLLKCFPI